MKKPKASSVSRAIAILSMLSKYKETVSVAEITERLNIPRATAYRIVGELESLNVLIYNPDTKRYKLGSRVLEFARGFNQSTSLIQIADPEMIKVRNLTGETISLNIPRNGERISIHEVRSQHALCWTVPPGTYGPLYAGSTGKAILAFMRPEEFDRVKKLIRLVPLTLHTPTDWETIDNQLKLVREQGYSITVGEVTEGTAGIAAPILDADGFCVASLNLSTPLPRWNKKVALKFTPLVIEAAKKISHDYHGKWE
jgi:DNA-binding IclR family transcriptional regulator